jgi:hypothetical protein
MYLYCAEITTIWNNLSMHISEEHLKELVLILLMLFLVKGLSGYVIKWLIL